MMKLECECGTWDHRHESFCPIATGQPNPEHVYDELIILFSMDSSEALYRAEAELPHKMFIDFVTEVTQEDDPYEDDEPDISFQYEHDSSMMSAGMGTDEDYGYFGGDD